MELSTIVGRLSLMTIELVCDGLQRVRHTIGVSKGAYWLFISISLCDLKKKKPQSAALKLIRQEKYYKYRNISNSFGERGTEHEERQNTIN
jgi:hypothetical protein